jgi:hypothetical protein
MSPDPVVSEARPAHKVLKEHAESGERRASRVTRARPDPEAKEVKRASEATRATKANAVLLAREDPLAISKQR